MKKPKNYLNETKNSKDIVAILNGLGKTVSELYDYVMYMDKRLAHMIREESEMTIDDLRNKNASEVTMRDLQNLKQELTTLINNKK
jgi:hypothetical protein